MELCWLEVEGGSEVEILQTYGRDVIGGALAAVGGLRIGTVRWGRSRGSWGWDSNGMESLRMGVGGRGRLSKGTPCEPGYGGEHA